MVSLIDERNRYGLLKVLSGYEKDREGFKKLLEQVKAAYIRSLYRNGSSDALQVKRIVDIIEEMYLSAQQNVGIQLICAVLVGKIT